MKMWRTRDEYVQHASCDGSVDHTLPPTRDDEIRWPDEVPKPVADREVIDRVCGMCPVRPECIKANCVDNKEHSVWVAGVWLPTPAAKGRRADREREVSQVRQDLIDSLPFEEACRPDLIL
ncbi:hypothetical protein [Mycolicibacterium palauense]|uniref:hypothetical protein n=1 Tax=Mycolicibacterium palauense TaxID=2034511 RepID=UPI000BFEF2C0|nr:hypothetical protein [Mycolicibacterium palauense]